MAIKTPITIAYGDGIGPEIMSATLSILEAANAEIATEVIEIGKKAYLEGYTSGIPDSAWESLKRTKVLLKGPITTPQGGGYKSLNVTLRKTLGLYANVRPCFSYYPYVPAKYAGVDLVIVRENEEDLYAGIEYRQSQDTYTCLKIISKQGCEKIIHYAFEYARKFNRKKVSCFTKDNIMKMTDGIFHRTFEEIAQEYPDIAHDHYIIDIGTALLATQPERFDVIVTLNLYGDIISDVAAQVVGSVGLAGSANVGDNMAMFEAIHGSAPDIAGKNIANPSGLLNAAVQMLVHIHQPEVATLIENAWLKTLEDGIHTGDIFSSAYSRQKVGTKEFAQAVTQRLGQKPEHFKPADYKSGIYTKIECYEGKKINHSQKNLVGVDVFIDNKDLLTAEALAEKLNTIKSQLQLNVINSRGLKIWPDSRIEAPDLSHCCARFLTDTNPLTLINHNEIWRLLQEMTKLNLDVIKTENLYTFNDELGFSLAQGQ
jgi:isocitrate dehydrogenase